MEHGTSEKEWTPGTVERRLIEAFRLLPSHPVFSRDGRVAAGDQRGILDALNWPARFVPERGERLALLTWARCRATKESVRQRYHELGWTRSSAEAARRRGLSRIVAGLQGFR